MNKMGESGEKSGEVTKGSRREGRKTVFKATGSLANLNVTGVLRFRKGAPQTCSVKGRKHFSFVGHLLSQLLASAI